MVNPRAIPKIVPTHDKELNWPLSHDSRKNSAEQWYESPISKLYEGLGPSFHAWGKARFRFSQNKLAFGHARTVLAYGSILM